MSYSNQYKDVEDIIDTLLVLDTFCAAKNIHVEFVVVGASGILLFIEMMSKEMVYRPTRDIDIRVTDGVVTTELKDALQEYEIEIVEGVIQFPPREDFQEVGFRHKIEGLFEAIDVYIPDIELLACTKIFSSRQKDLEDLENTNLLKLCDKNKLLELVEEYKSNMTWNDPFCNVHDLSRIFQEKGI
ncbi:DUF6036 family nucleotidyltransferase [Exiguobacterium sp. S3]|uniref:DUF6036 family nucleotidyltransferase n=1 Tax=Exiguobacterium sp. S3 TaxID=483245 RepID=UPI001BED19AF|nr:DUF6036 family nucleotidyltransferase [Exiguobacterium sp. S3]